MQPSNMQAEFVDLLFNQDAPTEILIPRSILIHYKQKIENRFLEHFDLIYPMVKYFSGSDLFKTMAKQYIEYFPCRHPAIKDYGEFFSDIMQDITLLHHLPFLHELAQFEWLCHELFFVSDYESVNAPLEQRSQLLTQSVVTLHPTCRLEQFHFPILSLRKCYLKKQMPLLNISKNPNYIFIYRPQFKLYFFNLKESEWLFFSYLQKKKTIAEALQKARSIDPHFQLPDLSAMIEQKIIVA